VLVHHLFSQLFIGGFEELQELDGSVCVLRGRKSTSIVLVLKYDFDCVGNFGLAMFETCDIAIFGKRKEKKNFVNNK
jgi:hypothetical protein